MEKYVNRLQNEHVLNPWLCEPAHLQNIKVKKKKKASFLSPCSLCQHEHGFGCSWLCSASKPPHPQPPIHPPPPRLLTYSIRSWQHPESLLLSARRPLPRSSLLHPVSLHFTSALSPRSHTDFHFSFSELFKATQLYVSRSHLIAVSVHLSLSSFSPSDHLSLLSSSLLLDDTCWVPHYSPISSHLSASPRLALVSFILVSPLPLIFFQHFDTACLAIFTF